jgi:cytochrome c oxidase subunit 3
MEGILKPNSLQRNKIHPHKFAMWVAMGSIAMMFAGLTSAYIVRQAQGNWRLFEMPTVFTISTIVIILSSITMHLGLRAFKKREMIKYRTLITSTLVLGVLFGVLQTVGFWQLYTQPQLTVLNGQQAMEIVTVSGNPSESFLFIITGLHLAHILGGIIALLIVFFMAYRKRVKVYNATGLEIVAGYWHFVDALWLYLFIFFLANQ